MINSKKVIKRFEDNPEVGFSNDKSIMAIAETVRAWYHETESEAKTTERILTHQTLNDYEKVAGIFFLGSLVTSGIFAAINAVGGIEAYAEKMKEVIGRELMSDD